MYLDFGSILFPWKNVFFKIFSIKVGELQQELIYWKFQLHKNIFAEVIAVQIPLKWPNLLQNKKVVSFG